MVFEILLLPDRIYNSSQITTESFSDVTPHLSVRGLNNRKT